MSAQPIDRPHQDRPNIVIVHGHDIGRYLGTYDRPVETPNLDRLQHEGLRFDNYFCPAPQCSPSRASMITGLYPNNNGMLGLAHLDWRLHDPRDALPHQLRAHGYATHLFGEQHEATEGELLGYETTEATEWPQLARQVATTFAARLPALAERQPFFASVGFFEAHRPFDHPGYQDDLPDHIPVPPYLPDEASVREDLAALHGRIKAVDEGVGTVLEALELTGLAQDTLVIFTTDHGLAFPRAKGTLYDSGLESALIMRWPGAVRPGPARQELLCNIDLAPTLLEIAGVEPRRPMDGTSFLPLLRGERQQVRDRFVCQLTWHDRYNPMRGIRTERWKYIRHFTDVERLYLPADVEDSLSGKAFREREAQVPRPSEELYDLDHDPFELQNLVPDLKDDEILRTFRTELDEWMRDNRDPLLDGPVSGRRSEAP